MRVGGVTLELRQGLNFYWGLQWRIFEQWTKVWFRNVLWMKKAFVVKFFRVMMIMTEVTGKKYWQIPVPAVAVIQEMLAVFVVIGCKGFVNSFFYGW